MLLLANGVEAQASLHVHVNIQYTIPCTIHPLIFQLRYRVQHCATQEEHEFWFGGGK